MKDEGELEVWSKPLSDGSRAVVLFNRSGNTANIAFSWAEVGLPSKMSFKVRDLWEKVDIGSFETAYEAEVPSHGAVMVKVY